MRKSIIDKNRADSGSRQSGKLIVIGSDKGGVGKSFVSTIVTDLLEIRGETADIAQIDDQGWLPGLYPGRVTTVLPASMEDLRRDPASIVTAFDPLYVAIEHMIAQRSTLVVDVGGPQQTVLEEYTALVDLDADLAEANVATTWLVPTTAEQESMRGAIRTAQAVGRILPSARRAIVLNRRDGGFRFYPGSPADQIWKEGMEPLCETLGHVDVQAIAAGSWQPFEAAGKRLIEVVGADIDEIRAWTGRSRPAAKVLRGDVAAFLSAVDTSFSRFLFETRGAGDEK